ncbi:putative cyclin-D6-1 [Cornus florida]|uniref:putative cyclin-D6-1 n=1 Tax=Cornus florida TaxID=4283 RepID=UPI00289680E8|nr:putative cyclin-D6-1 [Cornus florida]
MLIAFSCLSLAWKMRTVRFNLRELLDSLNFRNLPVVEVKKTELRIFSTLDWRMRSTTAFCFVDFFVSSLNIDNDSEQDLKRRVINNVLKKMHTDIEFTKFRPSIMAASALIAESTSSGPRIDLRQAFAPYVNMDELNRCADELARKIILGVVVSIRETHGTPESIPSDEE